MCFREATWTNGRKTVSGRWVYIWHRQRFVIELSSGRQFEVDGDSPKWGSWKLERSVNDNARRKPAIRLAERAAGD